MEPAIWADALNKFSQLTPWVQAVICLTFGGMVLGVAYFFKETIRVLIPFRREENVKK